MKRKQTVAIIYGLAEGKLMSQQFRCALENHGYLITQEPEKAAIIIAHSGGIFLIPQKYKAKQIYLVAPSIGTLSTWFQVQFTKVWIDLIEGKKQKMLGAVIFRNLINGFYLLIHPRYHLYMLWAYLHAVMQLPRLSAQKVIVIIYTKDPWSQFTLTVKKNYPRYTFIKRNGVHDDLWMHPKFYIDLLQKEMKFI